MHLLALISAALFATASAANKDGFLLVPITKDASSLEKRSDDGYVDGPLQNEYISYFAFAQFGKSLQTVKLFIDTGAWDSYVFGEGSGASYQYDNSSATDLHAKFYAGYASGRWVSGNYVEDQFTWGGSSIEFDFAVVPEYNASHMLPNGALGLSFPRKYSTYPVALREQSVIATAAFSLFLDNSDGQHSSLLFGAIDTSKYTGALNTVNVVEPDRYVIAYSIAGVSGQGLLDSGRAFTSLPLAVVEAAAESLNAGWNAQRKRWEYRGAGKPTTNLTVSFDGFDLYVPYTEIWRPYQRIPGYFLTFSSGSTTFGDDFLRAWYIVYDLDNHEISLGQASYNSGGNGEYITIQPSGVQASILDRVG